MAESIIKLTTWHENGREELGLNLSDNAYSKASDAILITGSARSGTTIMGKIIHSLKDVEYAYEPPMMLPLFAISQQLPEDSWRLLYEAYLYEEFMLNALAGRAINCNRSDDSSIYQVMATEEIEARLKNSLSKMQAEETARQRTLAYKVPDVVPYIPLLMQRYPETRVIIMLRNAADTLNSLIQKRWFSHENNTSALIWPFRKFQGVHVPYWVREGDDALWAGLSDVDRAAYYYIRVNESVEKIEGRIEVRYGMLLDHPKKVVSDVANKLGLSFGEKTEGLIAQVLPSAANRDKDILGKVSETFREAVEYYSDYSLSCHEEKNA